jgi:hypothetical protein
MTVRCANCRAELGDAMTCPACGTTVLSPQSVEQSDWRTDTAERSLGRPPVEPAPAASMPTAVRYPLYADELDVAADSAQPPQPPPAYAPAPAPAYVNDDEAEGDRGGVPGWVAWVIVAVVLVLVAVGGVWLLFSPGDEETAPDAPGETLSVPPATDESSVVPETSEASDAPASQLAPSGDPVDVSSAATATAPQTAPPNADAFGNRTTYVAANMLDGRPDTCWRMAGDGTGLELTFRLASATAITRVGMINGYAKNAVVGGRNLNWYVGNRRVLMAQWVFDDGTTVDQPLGATKQMQTIDIGATVTTSTVTLRLVSVSSPGTGRSARDYTAVSEVALVGIPSA